MIRIRYKHLSPGIHGKAEWSGRGTTVYLLPGLTWAQRSAALRRLRQEASRGCGPALPGPDLAVALFADRFRVGARNTAAVVRQHPAGSLVPTVLAGLLMSLFVLASVSARMATLPPVPAGGPGATGAPTPVGAPVLTSKAGASGPAGGTHQSGGSGAGGYSAAGSGAGAAGGSGAGSGSGSFSLATPPGSRSTAHSQPACGRATDHCQPPPAPRPAGTPVTRPPWPASPGALEGLT